jgi:hypothetical protein
MPATPATRRRIAAGLFVAAAVALVGWQAGGRFVRNGDGWEYLATLEALDRHGTFDVRDGDREAMLARLPEKHTPLDMYRREVFGPTAYAATPDGRVYPLHFWLYPLAAYPAKLALRAVGGPELNALRVTNAALFAAAVGAVLGRAAGSVGRRVQFALTLAVSPVVWHLPFTGGEVFSWAFATLAVVALDARRYARSGLAAGLAATQNPPLVLLAAVPVLCAACQRRWWRTAGAAAGAAVALLPVAFYLTHFGQPSLITRQHTDPSLVSAGRTLDLLFDLNVGLLPYVPVLLAAAPLGAAALAARRDARGVLVALAVAGMLLGVQVQVNWNSDCRGVMRYLVWMLPPLTWLAVGGLPGGWRTVTVAAAVGVHGGVLVFDPPTDWNYLEHRPLARWVMTHAPRWYDPDVQIFVERQAHAEDLPFEATPGAAKVALPLAFGREDGGVTKLLVHRESAARLTARFTVDPAYLPELRRVAGASERPVYVHPPPGAVRAQPGTVHGTIFADQDLTPNGGAP